MYVTVQRVQRGEGEGVNAFLHEHGVEPWPPHAHQVIALAPGKLLAEEIAVRPIGRNRVIAFLDIWFPDDGGAEIRSLLAGCREALAEEPPVVVAFGDAVASFGVELGAVDRRLELFDELAGTALRLLSKDQRQRS